MKFAAIALILGCSSLVVYRSAEQSNLSNQPRPIEVKTASFAGGISKPFELFFHPARKSNEAVTNLPAVPDPEPGTTKEEAIELIHKAAAKHGVSPAFVKSIVAAESNFNYAALSPKGAIGFMQLMPDTAQEFG